MFDVMAFLYFYATFTSKPVNDDSDKISGT